MITNPYQNVIDWLRTPEGETWSEARLLAGRVLNETGLTLTAYGDKELFCWKGILSLKTDAEARHTAMFLHSQGDGHGS
jgi:hypothetical protein